eukprot:CAMPEP_0118853854 /NCGR_PEP_ID=MMETSP1163-20130328/2288_1 /TAXON_ID=124430 /ORGANISM="Phaeomonas parva, Strain CCMP2877" /LENGTH=356 /DNA_ID=CAMNT_0006786475 /DNA_START=350 /DNA_END=1417 /DNA_ORIENTATION=-
MRVNASTPLPDATTEAFPFRDWGCRGEAGFGAVAELRRRLRAANGSDIFFSSEELDKLDISGTRYLRHVLDGYDVRVLILHRRRAGHLLSWWLEEQKHRLIKEDLAGWLRGRRHASNRSGLDLGAMLTAWGGAFGDSSITVASVDGMRASNVSTADVVAREFLGWGADARLPDARPNPKHNPSNTSPSTDLISLWAFVQTALLRGDVAAQAPRFPWFNGRPTRGYRCLRFSYTYLPRQITFSHPAHTCLKASELRRDAASALIARLGDAWRCWDAAEIAMNATQRDSVALRAHAEVCAREASPPVMPTSNTLKPMYPIPVYVARVQQVRTLYFGDASNPPGEARACAADPARLDAS